MLKEEKGCFIGFDGEVLLNLGAFLAAKGGIGQNNVVAVFFLNIGEVFCKRIGMHNVWRFHAARMRYALETWWFCCMIGYIILTAINKKEDVIWGGEMIRKYFFPIVGQSCKCHSEKLVKT